MLRAEYERRAKLKPLSWLNTMQLPLKNVYTRLKIISRRKADFQVENDELGMYDIFQALDESENVKMTLAEGSPGTGKTTFCLKLAYDWARGEMPSNCSFPNFEFVLLLKCRDINGDLMEAIKEQLLPEDIKEEAWTKLSDFITDIDNQERVLIILDGLDELPEKSRPCVRKLLNRKILPFCYVLATSRQEIGIEVRKKYEFDLLLEIKGFTDEDAFQYVRKHFQNIGPEQTSKGESLIVEIKENDLLNALRNNPLNLILLCVVYEDYKGKLPTARTELYQVVVQCLLRRYCAKHSLVAPEENSALEKQFEENILALGELAWMCLLSERHGFHESELAALEIRYKGLVARDIGLLYKEESLKRLNPQHEYFFLHKTFQEYLAAAFIAHKLRANELRLFERLSFHELVEKYGEAFLFVSGILGRDASILFTQIGEELKNWGEWDWDWCRQFEEDLSGWDNNEDRGWRAAKFLIESFKESGHDEQMAVTLCSFVPLPQHLTIHFYRSHVSDESGNIYDVLKACKKFANLQKPVEIFFQDSVLKDWNYDTLADCIESCLKLQSLSIATGAMTLPLAIVIRHGLSRCLSLSEFTLHVRDDIPHDAAVVIGEGLAASRSLSNVTFELDRVLGEDWASAIETGLCANPLLTSVVLKVRGILSDTAVRGLEKLLSNEALTIFSLNIFGDIQDLVTAAISNGLARQAALKSFELRIDGNLSLFGVNVLESSLLENRSLNDLKVFVRGKIPCNWQSLVENVRLAKKVSVTSDFYPDSCNRITRNQLAYFCPCPVIVEKGVETKQHLTVVLWGELSADGAETLCEALVRASPTSVTLKLHGKLSNVVTDCITRYVSQHSALSSMTIAIWGDLPSGTRTLVQALADKNVSVQVKVHDVRTVPNESWNSHDVSIDSPALLTRVFSKVKDARKEKLSIKVINDGEISKDWTRHIGNALAENTSLTVLDLTINNYVMTEDLGRRLGESLLRCSSLTVLNLATNNYSNTKKGWECSLVNSLSKVASLTTFSLAIDYHGEVRRVGEIGLGNDLMTIKSLSTLSIVINGSNLDEFWSYFLRNCLVENTSLTLLCVTVNNYSNNSNEESVDWFHYQEEEPDYWYEGLADGLARTTSLIELTLTINNINLISDCWIESVCKGLEENESVTTLTVTVDNSDFFDWVRDLFMGLAENKSLTTLNLKGNGYREGKLLEDFDSTRADEIDSPKNKSLTTLNLTINICGEVSEDWLPKLCDCLLNSCSLTTFRLNVNNHCATNESRIYDFSKLCLKYRSLSTFELTVTFYGE